MLIIKNKKIYKTLVIISTILIATTVLTGCVSTDVEGEKKNLIQTGSSTVLPLAVAWAEEFDEAEISVSGGGSTHGLNSLLTGNADLGDASRLLKEKDYESIGCDGSFVNEDGTAVASCNGVTPTKWVIAYDMLAIVINPDNTWATQLNYSQLYEIFTDDNPAVLWSDVTGLKNAPSEAIEIYAPDEASGTYDYFFEEIIPGWGKDDQQAGTRLEMENTIYQPSADDNVILNGIKSNKNTIGFFGFAYYKENPTAVNPVYISENDENNYEEPSLTNIADYPMARPLHIYTNGVPESGNVINDYLKYILSENGQDIVPEVGYVRLSLVDQTLLDNQLAKL